MSWLYFYLACAAYTFLWNAYRSACYGLDDPVVELVANTVAGLLWFIYWPLRLVAWMRQRPA